MTRLSVLHVGRGLIDAAEVVSLDSGRPLLEFGGYLVAALAPYPPVQIVLTTSWLQTLGAEKTEAFLPPELRRRVVGNTLSVVPRLSEFRNGSDRTWVIIRHARGMKISNWLAIDDSAHGVPDGYQQHFLRTDSQAALGASEIRRQLGAWLASHADAQGAKC